MAEKKEFIAHRKSIKYLDLFAGAGGFSEGFMQAYTDDKYCEAFYHYAKANSLCTLGESIVLFSSNYGVPYVLA